MYKIISIFFIALATINSLSFASPITLNLGHAVEVDHPIGQAAEYFAKLVEKRSGGDLKIKVSPSSTLGTQDTLLEKVASEDVNFALSNAAVMSNFVPELSVFDLPFLFTNVAHAYKALDIIGMQIAQNGEEKGMTTLAFWESGLRHMANNKRPIKHPDDMKGLKMRVMENPTYIEMMKNLGARAIPMSFSDLYLALENNVIDGIENPLSHISTKELYEVLKYLSLTGHIYAAEPLVISTKTWNRLTPEHREIIKHAAEDARDWQREICRDLEDQYLNQIKAAKTTGIIENIDKEAFSKATRPIWDTYINRFGEDNIKAIQNINKM